MGYKIMARYYAEKDNFGESYVITSTNENSDANLEVGSKVQLLPIESVSAVNIGINDMVAQTFDTPAVIADTSALPDLEEPTLEPQFYKDDKKSEPVEGPMFLTPEQLPEDCKDCPIRRTCPPTFIYDSEACNDDLSIYYHSKKKD